MRYSHILKGLIKKKVEVKNLSSSNREKANAGSGLYEKNSLTGLSKNLSKI